MLLPRPVRLTSGEGELVLDRNTTLSASDALTGVLHWLQGALRPATGLPLRESSEGTIRLGISDGGGLATEAFRLEVTTEGATITGGGPAGVFYGCQALLQLLPPAIYRRSPAHDVEWAVSAVRRAGRHRPSSGRWCRRRSAAGPDPS